MPSKPCAHPGCGVLVRGESRCAKHKKVANELKERNRETSAKRGYNSAWRRARAGYLAKHPLCVKCQAAGRVEPATVVDHIIPHRGDKELFWDKLNWQPLCKRCHDHKTATEDGGFTGWRGAHKRGGRVESLQPYLSETAWSVKFFYPRN